MIDSVLDPATGTADPTLSGRVHPGATSEPNGTSFLVWAPNASECDIHIVAPADQRLRLQMLQDGYFGGYLEGLGSGALYFVSLDGGPDRPDPASRFQPHGVHGPSQVVAPQPPLEATWRGLPLRDYVIYELHIGTFTTEGTFDAAIPHLRRLRDLGITAIEIMPVAEFPGCRNWGYDGVQPFAASSAYGGPQALRRLVDACHELGMAAILDVVYNHLGPEGNYLREFGPYFHHRYQTGWGDALNFDGANSDPVRRYFIENALYWVGELGFDSLRLDAIHAIYDRSAYPFLQELGDAVRALGAEQGREVFLIAESDLNDARVVTPVDRGGLGLDAQWADDLHHALHVVLTGQRDGYYADYGSVKMIAQALREGWVYSGQYSAVRSRRFGNSAASVRAEQLVVCTQNHDQVGNRMLGERLEHIVGFEAAKVAAATVILSPYVPMLFMGEEYAEPAPFLYFVSHGDSDLQEAVRKGRRAEFAAFAALAEPPDPQAESTFTASKLRQELASGGRHAEMQEWYRQLLHLRCSHPALRLTSKERIEVEYEEDTVYMLRRAESGESALVILHFGAGTRKLRLTGIDGAWRCVLGGAADRQPAEPFEVDLLPFQTLVYVNS